MTKIEGGLYAELMRRWLEDGKSSEDDRDPYALSHQGWGMNPQARVELDGAPGRHPRTQSRGRAGISRAISCFDGTEYAGGGKRATRGHYDVPMIRMHHRAGWQNVSSNRGRSSIRR